MGWRKNFKWDAYLVFSNEVAMVMVLGLSYAL